jgi:hypothetical protein
MPLPTDALKRKAMALWTYMFDYFPDAWLAELGVAVAGNAQHNKGEPMHWSREKSNDHLNTAFRHQFDYGLGTKRDMDGQWHLAKAVWRLKAQLQLDIEQERRELQAKPTDHHHIDTLRARVSAFPPAPCFDTFGPLDRAVDEMLALPQNGSSKTGEDI